MNVEYEKGMVLFEQGRWDLAAGQFRKAIAASPDSGPAHAMLALSLINDGHAEPALAEAGEAIRLDPEWGFAHLVRAQVLPHIFAGRYTLFTRIVGGTGGDSPGKRLRRARAALDEAIRLDPDDADAHWFAAHLENGRLRFRAALASAEKALELDPTYVSAANERARALTALGRAHEADRAIGATLTIDPGFAPSHAARGWSLLRVGRAAEAEAAFLQALRLQPTSVDARHGLFHARAAKWSLYRWPLVVFLERTQGVGEIVIALTVLVAAVLLFSLRLIHWQDAACIFLVVTFVVILVCRPIVHLTARFRR